MLKFDTQKESYHSVRVICDEMGLTVREKNLICACVFQESRFKNTAQGHNKDKKGNILSTDWGICQINDYWNIGKGKPFPSVQYVLENPEKVVRWMVKMYQQGLLKLWCSYTSNTYKVWLAPNSPMWKLKS